MLEPQGGELVEQLQHNDVHNVYTAMAPRTIVEEELISRMNATNNCQLFASVAESNK